MYVTSALHAEIFGFAHVLSKQPILYRIRCLGNSTD